MARKYPEGNYVYIHIRNDNGRVFYVGRGTEYRAWATKGRNAHWVNIFNKHGRTVEIVESGLTLDESKLLEKMVIELAVACDCPLANKTSGGDGVSGLVFDDESRIKMSRSQGGRRVFCSNGMVFDTGQKAAEWLQENGEGLALSGHISACARGERGSAWGHTWWYEGDEEREHIPRYERLSITSSREIRCSNGMTFRNAQYAADWIADNYNPSAASGPIRDCARNIALTAYGFTWWFTCDRPKTMEEQKLKLRYKNGVRFVCDGLVCFMGADSAIEHFIGEGVTRPGITNCLKGNSTLHAGHSWKYADE